MNSKSRATNREWDRDLFARFALGASFHPLWLLVLACVGHMEQGTYPAKMSLVRGVHGRGDVSLSQVTDGVVCVGSYGHGDTVWDIVAGLTTRMASVFSGLILLSFAMRMITGLGIKRHLTIRSSRRPLQQFYRRSGSPTDSPRPSF